MDPIFKAVYVSIVASVILFLVMLFLSLVVKGLRIINLTDEKKQS
ncbi:MAG: hypothetical protein AB1420_02650 [Bacillota bacterium]